jgi:hypothetical protein
MTRETSLAVLWLLCSSLISNTASGQAKSEPLPPYPAGSDITFQWIYSCPGGRICSFSCPGAGGASHVTRLTIYLGRMRISSDNHPLAVFYEFSTLEVPRGNGFAISSGLSTLACQVSGMMLDYSGSPK